MTTAFTHDHHRPWLVGVNLLMALAAIVLAIVALASVPDAAPAISQRPVTVEVDEPAPAAPVAPAARADDDVASPVPANSPARAADGTAAERDDVAFYGCDFSVSGGNRC
jgi:hypothetical protein